MAGGTDEDRWAEAQSVLDRTPTGAAEQRIRRTRRRALSLVLAVVVGTGAAVFTVLSLYVSGAPEPSRNVPTGRAIAGLAITGLAICVLIASVVLIVRTNRRLGAWRSPLAVLTRQQRRDLLAQVRGRVPVEAARLPVARYLAVLMLSRRPVLLLNGGIVLMLVGQSITFWSWYRLVLAGIAMGSIVIFWLALRRDERQARSFLAAHPAPGDESAA